MLILGLALAGAVGSAVMNEQPAPAALNTDAWMRTADDVASMPSVIWVDARRAEAFAAGHIDGAVNVSLENWDAGLGELLTVWMPGEVLVVYCDGEGCQLSRETAEKLRTDLADDQIYWLQGGIEAWEEYQQ